MYNMGESNREKVREETTVEKPVYIYTRKVNNETNIL